MSKKGNPIQSPPDRLSVSRELVQIGLSELGQILMNTAFCAHVMAKRPVEYTCRDRQTIRMALDSIGPKYRLWAIGELRAGCQEYRRRHEQRRAA